MQRSECNVLFQAQSPFLNKLVIPQSLTHFCISQEQFLRGAKNIFVLACVEALHTNESTIVFVVFADYCSPRKMRHAFIFVYKRERNVFALRLNLWFLVADLACYLTTFSSLSIYFEGSPTTRRWNIFAKQFICFEKKVTDKKSSRKSWRLLSSRIGLLLKREINENFWNSFRLKIQFGFPNLEFKSKSRSQLSWRDMISHDLKPGSSRKTNFS